MAIQRSILAGMTDFTGAEQSDIIEELDATISLTERSIMELSKLKLMVEQYFDKFDFPNYLLDHIDEFENKFERYLIELKRVRREVDYSIENRHVESINNLFVRCELDNNICRRFKNDNICRSMKDESVRYVVDKIYGVTMGVAVDYKNLSNMRGCLESYVGTVFKRKESAIDRVDKIIDLKPNIFGIGINLNNVIKYVPRFLSKRLKK